MKIVFLGTGTSVGVPVIGCSCPVCVSGDPRDRRRRSSLHVEAGGVHVVVDTPPDFREQALAYRVPRVDAVCFTHSHADHIFGFDDIRRYNTIQQASIPAYATARTMEDLKRIFDYILRGDEIPGVYRPRADFRTINGVIAIGGMTVEAMPVEHGMVDTVGYVFSADGRRVGYFPDCHRMSEDVVDRLKGVDVMILDALRDRPHVTHLTIDESVALLRRIGAGRSFVTHLCHEVGHAQAEARLSDGIRVACDGLAVEV